MAFEKDEIKLRKKFYYKQAYFYKSQALGHQNISDTIWVEDSIDGILSSAAILTQTDKEEVYQSQQFCLNIYYKHKDSNKKDFNVLHSKDAGPEDDAIEVTVQPTPKKVNTDEDKNPFRKPAEVEESEPQATTKYEPCLMQFGIWQEKVDVMQVTPLTQEINDF